MGARGIVEGMIPLWRVVRALLPMLILGAILLLIVALTPDPKLQEMLCVGGKGDGLGCQVYKFGFKDGWLRDLALILIGGPLVLAAYAEQLSKALAGIIGAAIRDNPTSLETVRKRLESGALSAPDIDDLMTTLCLYHDGTRNELRGEFGRFFGQIMTTLEQQAAYGYRTGYNETFNLSASNYKPDQYFQFKQSISYHIGDSGESVYPMRGYTAVVAAPDEIEEVLKHWSFVVELGTSRIDVRPHIAHLNIAALRSGTEQKSGPVTVNYDGQEIRMEIAQHLPLTGSGRLLMRSESGLMSRREVATTTSMRYPTRGAVIQVTVPSDFELMDYSFSPDQLHERCGIDLSDDRTYVRLSYDSWLMQGLCSVVSWRERA